MDENRFVVVSDSDGHIDYLVANFDGLSFIASIVDNELQLNINDVTTQQPLAILHRSSVRKLRQLLNHAWELNG